ncbi:MAG: peroxidase, partial [Solirubrobacterales bacterium]|nr:peroxidase [Solirubrobacterales bacterium]
MDDRVTRRGLLGRAALAGGGAALAGSGYAVGAAAVGDPAPARGGDGTGRVPYYGPHQPGILTPQQDRLHFAAFDLLSDRPEDLRELLRAWTAVAGRLQAGLEADAPARSPLAPPTDTG